MSTNTRKIYSLPISLKLVFEEVGIKRVIVGEAALDFKTIFFSKIFKFLHGSQGVAGSQGCLMLDMNVGSGMVNKNGFASVFSIL